MKVAVPKESAAGEKRVALTPDAVRRLTKDGWECQIEAGAGEAAYFSDADYQEAGASVVADRASLWAGADAVARVAPPSSAEIQQLPAGSAVVGFFDPLGQPQIAQQLARQNITALSLELIPRISRAQSMDALSSQANIAGYKSVLLGASALPKFLPMLTTAAGTIRPAQAFIVGAGVAGLQAIATARRLGALVEAFDIRPEVKEQVESLGATFAEAQLDEAATTESGYAREVSQDSQQRSQALIAECAARADIVITTAQVPGKRAPQLVTDAAIAQMQPGSVIVDLACEQGGNCEGIEAGREIQRHGVTLIGPAKLPSSMPVHASQMYARNVTSLLQHLIRDGGLQLDFEDDITDSTCLTHGGEIRNQRVKDALAVEGTTV